MRPDWWRKERTELLTGKHGRFWTPWLLASASVLALTGCQQKMATQPYYQPLEENTFFADGRASRPIEPHTVSRGDLRDDDSLYTGKVDGEMVTEFPISITEEVIARGQNRFNIYCAPCHSKLGDGNGMIVQRGVSRPPSFMDSRLTTAPVGHLYDVITNGYGRMYSYNQQIPVLDRWAIVSYVRVLQQAGTATLDDVPPAEREKLMQTSATTAMATFPSNQMNQASNTQAAAPAGGKL